MDVGTLLIPTENDLVLRGPAAASAIDEYEAKHPGEKVFALVGTAGTTNLGIIDDLAGLADTAAARKIWFHVDGAYGLAALCAPSVREKFNGIERCDSFIVDPHKWLFAPYDACALLYRNPEQGKQAHTQHASYLDVLENENEWNPSDYAIHLTRRPRGLPFWYSLAANGVNEYIVAMEATLKLAREVADRIKSHPNLELLREPTLSVVAFTRTGWGAEEYQKWSDKLLADQIGFVTPSAHRGQPILRFAIVNPWTQMSDLEAILATL